MSSKTGVLLISSNTRGEGEAERLTNLVATSVTAQEPVTVLTGRAGSLPRQVLERKNLTVIEHPMFTNPTMRSEQERGRVYSHDELAAVMRAETKGKNFRVVEYIDIHEQPNIGSAGGEVFADADIKLGVPHAMVGDLSEYGRAGVQKLVAVNPGQKLALAAAGLDAEIVLVRAHVDHERWRPDGPSVNPFSPVETPWIFSPGQVYIYDLLPGQEEDDLSRLYNGQIAMIRGVAHFNANAETPMPLVLADPKYLPDHAELERKYRLLNAEAADLGVQVTYGRVTPAMMRGSQLVLVPGRRYSGNVEAMRAAACGRDVAFAGGFNHRDGRESYLNPDQMSEAIGSALDRSYLRDMRRREEEQRAARFTTDQVERTWGDLLGYPSPRRRLPTDLQAFIDVTDKAAGIMREIASDGPPQSDEPFLAQVLSQTPLFVSTVRSDVHVGESIELARTPTGPMFLMTDGAHRSEGLRYLLSGVTEAGVTVVDKMRLDPYLVQGYGPEDLEFVDAAKFSVSLGKNFAKRAAESLGAEFYIIMDDDARGVSPVALMAGLRALIEDPTLTSVVVPFLDDRSTTNEIAREAALSSTPLGGDGVRICRTSTMGLSQWFYNEDWMRDLAVGLQTVGRLDVYARQTAYSLFETLVRAESEEFGDMVATMILRTYVQNFDADGPLEDGWWLNIGEGGWQVLKAKRLLSLKELRNYVEDWADLPENDVHRGMVRTRMLPALDVAIDTCKNIEPRQIQQVLEDAEARRKAFSELPAGPPISSPSEIVDYFSLEDQQRTLIPQPEVDPISFISIGELVSEQLETPRPTNAIDVFLVPGAREASQIVALWNRFDNTGEVSQEERNALASMAVALRHPVRSFAISSTRPAREMLVEAATSNLDEDRLERVFSVARDAYSPLGPESTGALQSINAVLDGMKIHGTVRDEFKAIATVAVLVQQASRRVNQNFDAALRSGPTNSSPTSSSAGPRFARFRELLIERRSGQASVENLLSGVSSLESMGKLAINVVANHSADSRRWLELATPFVTRVFGASVYAADVAWLDHNRAEMVEDFVNGDFAALYERLSAPGVPARLAMAPGLETAYAEPISFNSVGI